MYKLFLTLIFASVANSGWAITWGVEDLNNEYPNVGSVRGVYEPNNIAAISCSGSLLHKDADKFVILTAGHCTLLWDLGLNSGGITTVGVSFAQNNVVNGSYTDATYYLRGGMPITNPKLPFVWSLPGATIVNALGDDLGLVVFPANATDSLGNSLAPGIEPITIPPSVNYIDDVIKSYKVPKLELKFTSAGYGEGEHFPDPGKEQGPATPYGSNDANFLLRYIADNLGYAGYDQTKNLLHFSVNPAKDESGTCYGDSGAAISYKDPSSNVRIAIATVSAGYERICRSNLYGPKIDSASNFAFLQCAFVPGDADAVKACVDALPSN